MLQGFYDRDVSVVQADIFSNQGNAYLLLWMLPIVNHGDPVIKIRCRAWDMETFAGCIGKLLVLHSKNDFI